MLADHVAADADRYAAQFARREPFRHVVIERFFTDAVAQALLETFPPFEKGNARNEAGVPGNKSTVERIRNLGSIYAALDDQIRSPGFLALISRITGIPDLQYDPWYFGGGTHENRNGQDLDPHVDFNRHPVEPWHRRLNLIVYLNPEWDDAWGGSLELHSDPRAADNRITTVTPLFNRAVIFETTEWSWHGFSRITLPPERAGTSRRSIALYFYTSDRPADELASPHATIYVDRPLPARFAEGHTLTAQDVAELRQLIDRRDQHNRRLYDDIRRLGDQVAQLKRAVGGGLLGGMRYLAGRALALLRK
ncbi:2OG-Fe(II) oxygenase [Tahibacter amnicola]|uniref:2OG-Fe(II) oxygenase n=1 Tax=Tahibacter amnicola TaxID=2976241 RepID=A0ABY6BEH4_9GAMM|nr:2OG-Fe(II) oxygenase [Tahibacter amnicola]UXI67505.1 2OG-Fe(II) oxygenase [Tahibacter amnicola]